MVETPIHAINEGTSPVLSYNYGARRPDRVKKAGVVLIIMVLIYTGIMWNVILIAPEFLIGIFSSDKLLLKDAVPALKLYFAAFIFTESQEKRFPGRKPMKKKRWSFWKKKKQRNGNRINQDRYGVSVLFSCRDLFLSENKSL
jgi:hypothetical protein